MAAVFAARHVALGKRVAIKVMLPQCAVQPDIARRFVREGEAVARLFHPHVVDVTDVGTDVRGAPYLVMEYLEGSDLAAYLQVKPRLSVEQTADLLVPVVSAVAAAHDAGIVHRDLKPQNLFMARERDIVVPKVLDFGISKLMHAESVELTSQGAILGTPYYLSPEQAQGMEVDERTDQFSLGVILYECVAGRRPFEGHAPVLVITNIVTLRPTPLSKLVPSVDPRFEAVVNRALQKDPNKRFADMRELGRALIECASVRTRFSFGQEFGLAPKQPSEPTQPSPRRSRSKPAVLAAFSAVLLSLVCLTAWSNALPGASERVAKPLLPRTIDQAGITGARIPPLVVPSKETAEPRPAALPEPSAPTVPARYQFELEVQPATAQLSLDGVLVGRGTLRVSLPRDGAEHVLEASLPGHRSQRVAFRDAPPRRTTWTLERVPSAVLLRGV
ncbi:MAG: serine/threonine protein kinase, partial [Myxococcaceae bacterium]|nr:serine/threonine protein kinase [Myxococcaceae bacterium]